MATESPRTSPLEASILRSPPSRAERGLAARAGARRPAPSGGAEPGAGRGADARLGRALAAWLGRSRALRHSPAPAVSGRGPVRLRRFLPRWSSSGAGGGEVGDQGRFESAFCDGEQNEGAQDGHSLHSAAPREDAWGLGAERGAWVRFGLGNGRNPVTADEGSGEE